MENKRKIRPYGTLIVGPKEYKLMAPHAIGKDSWMNDGMYQFSCADWDDQKLAYIGCMVIVSGTFCVKLSESLDPIEVTFLSEDIDELSMTEEEMQAAEEWVQQTDDWDMDEDVSWVLTEDSPTEDSPTEDEMFGEVENE